MFKLVSTLELLFTTSIITIRALNIFLIGLSFDICHSLPSLLLLIGACSRRGLAATKLYPNNAGDFMLYCRHRLAAQNTCIIGPSLSA